MHPKGSTVLAGDDNLALPIISVGGNGVIAVISNYAPKTYGALIRSAAGRAVTTTRLRQVQHHAEHHGSKPTFWRATRSR